MVNLGILYTGAKLGWVVPNHIPKSELSSIADLKKSSVSSKLGGKVQATPSYELTHLSATPEAVAQLRRALFKGKFTTTWKGKA